MIPQVMRAIRLHAADGLAKIVIEQIETPQPQRGEALVRVHAAAITRDELDWPTDRLPAIPSYEFSGVVAMVAADVEDVGAGDSVFALSGFDRDGAAAEYIAIPSRFLASKPRRLDHTEAAAVPLAGLSAWQGLFDHGHLAAGQRVLIHGVAGGVGSFAAQLARDAGAQVIGTASPRNVDVSSARRRWCAAAAGWCRSRHSPPPGARQNVESLRRTSSSSLTECSLRSWWH